MIDIEAVGVVVVPSAATVVVAAVADDPIAQTEAGDALDKAEGLFSSMKQVFLPSEIYMTLSCVSTARKSIFTIFNKVTRSNKISRFMLLLLC